MGGTEDADAAAPLPAMMWIHQRVPWSRDGQIRGVVGFSVAPRATASQGPTSP